MKHRPPAFQFYPRQFAGDDCVMGMDLEAIGAHILLICVAASSPERYRIHADEYAIRMRLRNPSNDDWQRIKKQLLSGAWKISEDGQWWIQNGLQRTFEKQEEFSDKQRDRAKARWRPRDAKSVPDGMRHRCRSDAGWMLFIFFFIFKSKHYVRTLPVELRLDSPRKVLSAVDSRRTAARPTA
jgi:hypothetical protein